MKFNMSNKKLILSCCFGIITLIGIIFTWTQGPYVYHPAKTKADLHDKSDKNPKLVHGFFSTKPTPDGVYYRNKVIVLMYHDVSANPINNKSLDVTVFQKQLDSMKNNNFHWITMEQYANFITKHAPVPDNAVLMTFDDGYESFYKYAFPLLQKYQVPATNFLIVSTIGNKNHIGIKKLNWDEVKAMHKSGIDFYNHTYDSHKYDWVLIPGKRKAMLAPLLMGPIDDVKYNRHESSNSMFGALLTIWVELITY
ncbi:polysaccharide deacetylase family protein [Paenibacillus pini]|uniref:Polysaccharide deacetylase n=1 Tax=Paenibacillus pini JCM 16418 TaxID=1236976 RepID=W7YXR7_9BACL|nr:polysaccharide deacetylase family protein [Paenibacillus pini]GAF09466.1 polysaccharide deacetylase [Paenibacillus pini JCM 16418]